MEGATRIWSTVATDACYFSKKAITVGLSLKPFRVGIGFCQGYVLSPLELDETWAHDLMQVSEMRICFQIQGHGIFFRKERIALKWVMVRGSATLTEGQFSDCSFVGTKEICG